MTTKTDRSLHEMTPDERWDVREAIRAAYDTMRNATRDSVPPVPADATITERAEAAQRWLDVFRTAESGFDAHITFRRGVDANRYYRRYCVLWDGVRVGWVVGDEHGKWDAWTIVVGEFTGHREVVGATSRKEAARDVVCDIAISGFRGVSR